MSETLVEFESRSDFEKTIPESEPSSDHCSGERPIADLRGMQVLIARTDADRDRSYRLRYQVYCIENDFEPASHYPDGRETDLYDQQSVHGLLIYRDTEAVAGTARLILPRRKNADQPLPTPQICAPQILAAHSHRIPADSTAELSRFAISKSSRPHNPTGTVSLGIVSTLSLGLMRGVVAMASANGITHLYALMEPALLRMLRGLGIHFEKLGPVVDYHGRRQPCFCDLNLLLGTTLLERPDIWAFLTINGGLSRRKSRSGNPVAGLTGLSGNKMAGTGRARRR
jgi:N-acyl amino acid synthase of PEP-CTERM/exosortase system